MPREPVVLWVRWRRTAHERGGRQQQERGDTLTAKEITINVNTAGLDVAIEKANRLLELLREAASIIDSLSGRESERQQNFTVTGDVTIKDVAKAIGDIRPKVLKTFGS